MVICMKYTWILVNKSRPVYTFRWTAPVVLEGTRSLAVFVRRQRVGPYSRTCGTVRCETLLFPNWVWQTHGQQLESLEFCRHSNSGWSGIHSWTAAACHFSRRCFGNQSGRNAKVINRGLKLTFHCECCFSVVIYLLCSRISVIIVLSQACNYSNVMSW